MKILEVTGFGNKEKHLIPLNNIIAIHFDERYTSIILAGGNKVNVIEIEPTIKEMLEYFESEIISENDLENLWWGRGNDDVDEDFKEYQKGELPF